MMAPERRTEAALPMGTCIDDHLTSSLLNLVIPRYSSLKKYVKFNVNTVDMLSFLLNVRP
jgi:hypothetical protein